MSKRSEDMAHRAINFHGPVFIFVTDRVMGENLDLEYNMVCCSMVPVCCEHVANEQTRMACIHRRSCRNFPFGQN